MSRDIISRLQAELRLAASPEAIDRNRVLIDSALDMLKAEVKAAEALRRANQEMCDHKLKVAYNDPRDSGWDCPTCGASR